MRNEPTEDKLAHPAYANSKNLPAEKDIDTAEAQQAPTKSDIFLLRLYVAGQTPKSVLAFANLKNIWPGVIKLKW